MRTVLKYTDGTTKVIDLKAGFVRKKETVLVDGPDAAGADQTIQGGRGETRMTVPPETAFLCDAAELDSWEAGDHGDLYGTFLIVRQPCKKHGWDYDGWIVPSESSGSTYLAGWFSGRRSRDLKGIS